jgi:hypothetical protein
MEHSRIDEKTAGEDVTAKKRPRQASSPRTYSGTIHLIAMEGPRNRERRPGKL